MYEYPMYSKILGISDGVMVHSETKKNVCKILVEPNSTFRVRSAIFSIHMEVMVHVQSVLLLYVPIRTRTLFRPVLSTSTGA